MGSSNASVSLAEKARNLAPVLRERAEETTKLRRLPDSTWQDLITTGLVRGLQPQRWGGGEADLRDFYEGVVEVARADGSTGWVLGIAGVHPWQTATFPLQTQEEMWGKDPTVINSSSYAPTGKAVRVSGGYRLNGRWSFSTGCDHCSWVNLGAIVGTVKIEGKAVPDFHSFLLPRTDYRIDDNWHVVGLAGTGSKDIVVEDAFVPEHRSQSHWDYVFDRPLPGWEVNPSPLYRLPFGPVFNTTLAAAVIGASAGFLDQWSEINRTRKSGLGIRLAQDSSTQQLLAEARYTVDSAMLRLYTDAEALMTAVRSGESIPLKRRAELRYHACRSAQLCSRTVDRLFEASSGRAIFFDHPLQRRYQDVKAMMGHTYLNPDQPARLYGAMELGLPVLDAFL